MDFDTKLNKNIHSIDCYEEKSVLDIMNGQNERIAELEEQLENYKLCRCVDCSTEYEKGLETSIDELEKENRQLKQQLHDLPNKIVEEIKKVSDTVILWWSSEVYDYTITAKNLDTILKKYGGKYE